MVAPHLPRVQASMGRLGGQGQAMAASVARSLRSVVAEEGGAFQIVEVAFLVGMVVVVEGEE